MTSCSLPGVRVLAVRALPSIMVMAVGIGCVFDVEIGREAPVPRPLNAPFVGPIDILFVVDNSGSMREEQNALSQALVKEGCPIDDLRAVPQALMNPAGDTLDNLVEACGLAQLLAAYDRDFRIGVITTDVNACDNLFPSQMGGEERGFRPQRGCLQPVPGTGAKVLTRDAPALADDFVDLLRGVGTYGSSFERGLDAAQIFLSGDEWVGPGCEGDRDLFLRESAELLVVFVSDEDDCSHLGAPSFVDETSEICGENLSFFTNNAAACYSDAASLTPVSAYAARMRALKEPGIPVRVAVIGGAAEESGRIEGSGCLLPDTGDVSTACFESGGLSNFTLADAPCSEQTADERGGLPCCTADGAGRYFALRDSLAEGSFHGASICQGDFRVELIEASVAAGFDE